MVGRVGGCGVGGREGGMGVVDGYEEDGGDEIGLMGGIEHDGISKFEQSLPDISLAVKAFDC